MSKTNAPVPEGGVGNASIKNLKLGATPPSPRPTERGESGKGGLAGAPAEFMAALITDMPEGAHSLVCSKPGDPGQGGWHAQDGSLVATVCPPDHNNYVNCSSVYPDDDGKLAARKDRFAAYHFVLLDDVGTKVDRALLADFVPTAEIETSPGNSQVVIKLKEPITDQKQVSYLQQALAAAGLTDKGAQGTMRWARLPDSINGKPKHRDKNGNPYPVRVKVLNPEVVYTPEEIQDQLVPKVSAPPATAPRPFGTVDPLPPPTAPGSDVYMPRSAESPIVTRSKEVGIYKGQLAPGIHDITCPLVHEHTDSVDDGARLIDPSPDYPLGGLKCHHSHGENLKLRHLLDFLGLDRRAALNRPCIRITPGEIPAMIDGALHALAETGEIYQLNGKLVKVTFDCATGKYSFEPLSDGALTLLLAKTVLWQVRKGESWRSANPDRETIRLLAQMKVYAHVPVLKGVVWQPLLDENGNLIIEPGYHPAAQLFLAFDPGKYSFPEPTRTNAEAALTRLIALLNEFRFALPPDLAATLAAIFTATLRACLGRAPAFHLRAPAPGSGKSYLGDLIARFASPNPPAKVSYPRTDEEATKTVLAVLRQAPAVLDFDDMATDWKPHSAINRMLTAGSLTDRLLGQSETATVNTDVLVLGSGNNTGPLGDLLRRVLVIDLDTKEEQPATIQYEGDPLADMGQRRETFVSDVLTIVRAYIAAGKPKAELPSIATYNGRWSEFCRQPLVWLGLDDPAQGLIEQLKSDESRPILGALLKAWHDRFGERPMKVRDFRDEMDGPLARAIEDLPFMEGGPFNAGKFGWYLKRNANRLVDGYRLEKAPNSERNAWRVVRVDGAAPPLPLSPLSGEPGAGRRFD